MTSPISRVRALPSPRPETSGRYVVVRVSEVILRLHLDQRAPHALHDEHKLPQPCLVEVRGGVGCGRVSRENLLETQSLEQTRRAQIKLSHHIKSHHISSSQLLKTHLLRSGAAVKSLLIIAVKKLQVDRFFHGPHLGPQEIVHHKLVARVGQHALQGNRRSHDPFQRRPGVGRYFRVERRARAPPDIPESVGNHFRPVQGEVRTCE